MQNISSAAPEVLSTRVGGEGVSYNHRSEREVSSMAIESVEAELENMKVSDLKKLRLLKVAWVVSIVIGTAIFFVIPLSMVFGIPLWIPILASLGFSIALGYTSGKISSKKQEILRRYEFLRAYHQRLISSGVKKPFAKKFHITKEELFTGMRSNFQRRMERIKDELLLGRKSRGEEEDHNSIKALDLQGNAFESRYEMQDLFLGEEKNRTAYWQGFANAVLDINNRTAKGEDCSGALESVSLSALMAGGVQHLMIPGHNFDEQSDRVQGLLKRGAAVLSLLQEDYALYDSVFYNNSILKQLSPLPPAVAEFKESSNLLLLDVLGRLSTLEGLQEAVEEQKAAIQEISKEINGCSIFERLCTKVYQSAHKGKGLLLEGLSSQRYRLFFGSVLSELDDLQMHLKSLLNEESCCDKRWAGEDDFLGLLQELKVQIGVFKETLHTDQDKQCVEKLIETLRRIQEKVESLPEGRRIIDKIRSMSKHEKLLRKSQCNFVVKLSELGEETFLTRLRLGIRGCSAVSKELSKAVAATPERKLFSSRLLLSLAARRLEDASWGTSGSDPVDNILEKKAELRFTIKGLEEEIALVEKDFDSFKNSDLSKLFFQDSQNKLQSLMNKITSYNERAVEDDLVSQYNELVSKLGQIGQGDGALSEAMLASPRELVDIIMRYGSFLQRIQGLITKISSAVEAVGRGCESKTFSFKSLLLDKDSKISQRSAEVTEEVQKKVEAEQLLNAGNSRQSIEQLLGKYLDSLRTVREHMEDFEAVLSEEDILAEKAIFSADKFLQTLGKAQESAATVQSILTMLSSSPEEFRWEQSRDMPLSGMGGSSEVKEKYLSRVVKEMNETRSRLAKGLENIAMQAKQSLRQWNLSKSIMTTILSLCVFIAAIFVLNMQVWWLPLLFVGIGMVFIGVDHIFDKVIENKTKAMVTEQIALKLSNEDLVSETDFGNENVSRLARLQQTLCLDGCSRTWAREVVSELEGMTTGETSRDILSSKQEAIKHVREWGRDLDKRMLKRFGSTSLGNKDAEEGQVVKEYDKSWQEREAARNREMELMLHEDQLVGRLGRVRALLHKIEQEQSFSTSLSDQVSKGKALHNQNTRCAQFYDSLIKCLAMSVDMSITGREGADALLPRNSSKSILDMARLFSDADPEVRERAKEAFDREVFLLMEKDTIGEAMNSLVILMGSKDFPPSQHTVSEARRKDVSVALSRVKKVGCDQLSPVVRLVFNQGRKKVSDAIDALSLVLESNTLLREKTVLDLLEEDHNSVERVAITKNAAKALSIVKEFSNKASSVAGLRYATSKSPVVENIREVAVEINKLKEKVSSRDKSEMGNTAKAAKERIEKLIYREHVKFRKNSTALKELCGYIEKTLKDPEFKNESVLRSILQKLSKTPTYLLKEELNFNRARFLLVNQKIRDYNLLEEKSCFVKALVSERVHESEALKQERIECEKMLDQLRKSE